MKKKVWIVTGIVLAVAGALFAAQEGMHRMHHPGIGIVRHVMSDLNVTTDQKAQLRQILAKERVQLEPLLGQVMQAHRKLEAQTANGAFDETAVRNAVAGQTQNITELIVAKERIKSEVMAVLTPDQRAKLQQMHRDFGGDKTPDIHQRLDELDKVLSE